MQLPEHNTHPTTCMKDKYQAVICEGTQWLK